MLANLFTKHKYLVVFALLICCCSCNNNKKNDDLFKAMNEGLMNSNTQLDASILRIYNGLREKIKDPVTKEKATFFFEKANLIQDLSDELNNSIETTKSSLKNKDVKEVEHFLFTEGKADKLYNELKKYRKNILEIDSIMYERMNDAFIITTLDFDTAASNKKDFATNFFKNASPTATAALLSKFQNNIKNIELKALTYCYNQTREIIHTYETFKAIVAQSSTHIKAGDKIEITAGIGSFSWQAQPQFYIDKKLIPASIDGTCYTSLISSTKAGKHEVPFIIEFIKPDGTKATYTKNIIYYVDSCR